MHKSIVDLDRALLVRWDNFADHVVAEWCIYTPVIYLIAGFGDVSCAIANVSDGFVTFVPERDVPKNYRIKPAFLPSVFRDLEK